MTHVLLAEDYDDFAERITRMLEPLGVSVRHAIDGLVAVNLIADASVPIDLLITDLTMPNRSGWHVIAAMQEHRPGIPIIMQSGEAGDSWVQQEAQRLGVPLVPKERIDDDLLATIVATGLIVRY